MDSIGGYLTVSTNVSCYQTVVDDNAICLSATQLMHKPAHGARNTVQQLLCKTPFLLSYGPNRPELNRLITRLRESTTARIWVGSQQN